MFVLNLPPVTKALRVLMFSVVMTGFTAVAQADSFTLNDEILNYNENVTYEMDIYCNNQTGSAPTSPNHKYTKVFLGSPTYNYKHTIGRTFFSPYPTGGGYGKVYKLTNGVNRVHVATINGT